MLKFNEQEFLAKQDSMLALAPRIREFVAGQLPSLRNVFLVGSGGTYAAMLPYELLMHQTSTLPTRVAISSELVSCGDASLGEGSLCVFASVSGTTKDVLEAIEYCNAQGATTVAFTGYEDSPIAKSATHTFLSLPEAWPFDLQLIMLTAGLREGRGEFADADRLFSELAGIGPALVQVAEQGEQFAEKFADSHVTSDGYFVVGAGNTWGFAYLYSMCILEEMQWLHTTRVHAAEFFHGSLELVEQGTPVLLMKGEDCSRRLVDRVERFADQYSGDVTVVDSKDYPLTGISDEFRALLSPLVLDTVCSRISKHLERVRNHSLDERRYYRKVEY